jgi:polyhydroxybutyrate depolymerase
VIREHRSVYRILVWASMVMLAWLAVISVLPSRGAVEDTSRGCARLPKTHHRFIARLPIDGLQRSALVNLPPGARAQAPLPLVLTFHGAGGNGRATESTTGMTDLGNRDGFIAVYPNSIGRSWGVTGRSPRPGDDVLFVSSLLDELDAQVCIDESRIYATGVSNGGSFVARIGCELSDRLSAIAPVAGGYGVQPPCQPQRPVSVLEIHGTDDRTVPYSGVGSSGETGVWPFLSQWNAWDGCPGAPPVWRRLAPRALWVAKAGCAAGVTVAHIKLIGEPHAWPTTKWVEPRPHVGVLFSARRAIWQFFETEKVAPDPSTHARARR